MANVLKLPPITAATKVLSFDLEANGLHGEAFAVGALVMDAAGNIADQFSGRAAISGEIDEWVEQHVLPAIDDMPVDYADYQTLRAAFWSWFVAAQKQADYVLVQNGYPVEYRFLIQCQDDDIDARYWEHPFPILDLTSMTVQARQDIRELRHTVISKRTDLVGKSHHPLYDAKITAFMAFELLGR